MVQFPSISLRVQQVPLNSWVAIASAQLISKGISQIPSHMAAAPMAVFSRGAKVKRVIRSFMFVLSVVIKQEGLKNEQSAVCWMLLVAGSGQAESISRRQCLLDELSM